MSYEDYLTNLEYTDISWDTNGWKHSGFMMHDDTEPYKKTELFGDGVRYNEHILTIRSPSTQNILGTMHTYHFKHYHGECDQTWGSSEVLVFHKDVENLLMTANPGSYTSIE